MNTKLIKEVVENLNDWRDAYFSGEDPANYDEFGYREVEDLLSGIQVDDIDCYASHLFDQLTDEERKEVLRSIDFHVDFDDVAAYYMVN